MSSATNCWAGSAFWNSAGASGRRKDRDDVPDQRRRHPDSGFLNVAAVLVGSTNRKEIRIENEQRTSIRTADRAVDTGS